MTEQRETVAIAHWAKHIDDLDREICRLCLLCQVRILDPGIIERVLRKDDSVCGARNSVAFAKLHDMLTFYFGVREKSVDAVGAPATEQIEARAVEQLRTRFAGLLGKWPPE